MFFGDTSESFTSLCSLMSHCFFKFSCPEKSTTKATPCLCLSLAASTGWSFTGSLYVLFTMSFLSFLTLHLISLQKNPCGPGWSENRTLKNLTGIWKKPVSIRWFCCNYGERLNGKWRREADRKAGKHHRRNSDMTNPLWSAKLENPMMLNHAAPEHVQWPLL